MSLEVVETEASPVGDFDKALVFLIETKGIVMVFLGVLSFSFCLIH